MKVSGNPTPVNKLIYRLRLMAGAGGMLTRDRIKTVMEAADRLEEFDERIAIMMESASEDNPMDADAFQEDWR